MKALLPLLICALVTPAMHAATVVNVSFTADGSSRFSDHLYNVYAELGYGNYLWAIADGTTGPPGGGSLFVLANEMVGTEVVFPAGGSWSNAGSFMLDGTATGVGVETFSITGATFNFSPYMSYDDSALGEAFGDYATLIQAIPSGTIQLTDGMVTDLNFMGNVVFAYGAPESGDYLFGGTLGIDEDGFNLAVGSGEPFSIDYRWEATGSSSFAVVPEPSVALLGLAGVAVTFRRRRS